MMQPLLENVAMNDSRDDSSPNRRNEFEDAFGPPSTTRKAEPTFSEENGSDTVVLEVTAEGKQATTNTGRVSDGDVSHKPSEAGSEAAALRASDAQEALESLALFTQGDEEEEDEDDAEGAGAAGKPWYARRRTQFAVALNVLSLGAICAGVALQLLPTRYEYFFRWLYFGGTVVPLFCVLSLLMERVFEEIELHYFRDTLSYLATLEKATVLLLLALFEMAWFYVIFELLFCAGRYSGQCDDVEYQMAVYTVERVLLCVLLFAGACWISSGATKAASTHFYRTAHFKKMQEALEKEYYLQALSAPKRKALRRHQRIPNSSRPNPARDAGQRSQFQRRSHFVADRSPGESAATSLASSRADSILPSPASSYAHMDGPLMSSYNAGTSGNVAEVPNEADHTPPHRSEFGSENSDQDDAGGLLPPQEDDGRGHDLSEEMFRAFAMSGEEEQATVEELQDEDRLEKLRTAVVVKTYSKLMEHYRSASAETAAAMMRNVKAFSAALFKNLSGSSSRRKSVTLPDFELFFPSTQEGRASAVRAFELFDVSNDGRVSKAEVKEVVMNIFRDRANIAGSLIDTDSIVQSLEHGFSGLIHFLFVGLYLLVWDINVVAGFATFSATLVGLSFIFGNSIRTIFESLVFLFSRHPYDVGDWVVVKGEKFQVKKARLLFTMMTNLAGHPVYMSNSDLNNQKIDNLSRSSSHTDYNEIQVRALLYTLSLAWGLLLLSTVL